MFSVIKMQQQFNERTEQNQKLANPHLSPRISFTSDKLEFTLHNDGLGVAILGNYQMILNERIYNIKLEKDQKIFKKELRKKYKRFGHIRIDIPERIEMGNHINFMEIYPNIFDHNKFRNLQLFLDNCAHFEKNIFYVVRYESIFGIKDLCLSLIKYH